MSTWNKTATFGDVYKKTKGVLLYVTKLSWLVIK